MNINNANRNIKIKIANIERQMNIIEANGNKLSIMYKKETDPILRNVIIKMMDRLDDQFTILNKRHNSLRRRKNMNNMNNMTRQNKIANIERQMNNLNSNGNKLNTMLGREKNPILKNVIRKMINQIDVELNMLNKRRNILDSRKKLRIR